LRTPSITAFFPAYNDAESIGGLVGKADATLRELTSDYEIVVVNDGSRDRTAEILEGLRQKHPFLRVIHHERNRDYGGALRSGFRSATKELVFYTDGDGQYDPAEMRQLVTALAEDVDVVQGYKLERHDPVYRIIIGEFYGWCVRFLFGLKIRDVDCDFRLIRREALKAVDLTIDSGAICVELVRKLQDGGFRFREVPVHHHPRQFGRSQFFFPRRILRTWRDLLRLRVELLGVR
jgi:glycosyltransferase involved in cell wall biosynthesis